MGPRRNAVHLAVTLDLLGYGPFAIFTARGYERSERLGGSTNLMSARSRLASVFGSVPGELRSSVAQLHSSQIILSAAMKLIRSGETLARVAIRSISRRTRLCASNAPQSSWRTPDAV